MNKSFKACPLPWIQLSILPDGKVRLCCHSNISNINLSENLRPFYIEKDSLTDILNSNWIENIKEEFTKGIIPKSCTYCYSKNAQHSDNPAMYYREMFGKPEEFPSWASPRIEYLDLSLTRTCNLQCMMCSPSFSTGLETLYKKGIGKIKNVNPFSLEFIESEDFNELTRHLSSLLLQGGEPFLSTLHVPILKKLVELKKAKNITLNYITNGTVFPGPDVLDLWQEFAKVNLEVSLDDVGRHAEYIRYPLKWPSFEKNFERLSLLVDSGQVSLDTTLTYQVLNILSLPRVFSFLKQYSVKSRVPIINILEDPKFLNFLWLPRETKESAVKGLELLSQKEALTELELSRLSFLKKKILEKTEGDLSHLKSDFIIHMKRTKTLRKGRGPELGEVTDFKI